jgi:hypothetical protein
LWNILQKEEDLYREKRSLNFKKMIREKEKRKSQKGEPKRKLKEEEWLD